MAFTVAKVDVWSTGIPDEPGGLDQRESDGTGGSTRIINFMEYTILEGNWQRTASKGVSITNSSVV